nr:shikimate kinase [uncultured Kingella sp.]
MDYIAGNLFLVGLMGAGKTTQGKRLARHLNRSFFDSDQVICERTGVNIPTIFEMEGEDGFRHRESNIINELTALPNIVLATGGGAILREQNRDYLRGRGLVVYLHVQPETLFERVGKDKNRPLLQVQDALAKFRDLYRLRDAIYRQTAHIVIEVGVDDCQTTFEQILRCAAEYERNLA